MCELWKVCTQACANICTCIHVEIYVMTLPKYSEGWNRTLLLSLLALRSGQICQYPDSAFQWQRLCTCVTNGYESCSTKRECVFQTDNIILFFCLPESWCFLWEACLRSPKDATEATNWLTQSLKDQQRFRKSTFFFFSWTKSFIWGWRVIFS